MRASLGQILVNSVLPEEIRDYNRVLDAKTVGKLMNVLAKNYPEEYADILKGLYDVGGLSAYTSGHSVTLNDLNSLSLTSAEAERIKKKVEDIAESARPKFEKDQELARTLSDLAQAQEDMVLSTLRKEDNPLAHEVDSGARGNKTQLNSMVGSTIMVSDKNDNPVPLPVIHNYAEGLDPAEYWAYSHGTRKGAIATKLCVFEQTEVLMADGSVKQIRHIVAGDRVMGADTQGNLSPTTVKQVFDNGLRDCNEYAFRVNNCKKRFVRVTCTDDHKLLAQIRAGRPGSTYGHKSIYTSSVLPLSAAAVRADPTKNTFVAIPACGETVERGIHNSIALLYGVLLGDGCTCSNGKPNWAVSCADPTMLKDLDEYLASIDLALGGDCKKSYTHQLVSTFVAPFVRGSDGKIQETGHPTKKKCLQLGVMGKYAHEKTLSEQVWGWDPASIRALIGGYFSCDGSIYRRGEYATISIASVSKELLEGIRRLLELRLGIWCSSISESSPELPSRQGTAVNTLYSFTISHLQAVTKFLTTVPMVGKKRLLAAKVLATLPQARPQNSEYSFKLFSKTSVGNKATFDLEVDNPDHLFVLANGLIVSNSTADAGFLGKQLSLAAHKLTVTDDPPEPGVGLPVDADDPDNEGSVLAADVGKYKAGTAITASMLKDWPKGVKKILVYSPISNTGYNGGVPQVAAGIREDGDYPAPGDNIGLSAVQTISERLSQGSLNVKHCLFSETLVRMADGTAKAIKNIEPGEYVLGSDQVGRLRTTRVRRVFNNGLRPCQQYIFRYGTATQTFAITATADHLILGTSRTTNDSLEQYNHVPRKLPLGFERRDFYAVLPQGSDQPTGNPTQLRRCCVTDAGQLPTFDLEVDHPDHLFVLANGLIVSNSGGAGGKGRGGFKVIEQLLQVPKEFPSGAAHASEDGQVGAIVDAPQGGKYIEIGGHRYYVDVDQEPTVKPGDRVEAGDAMSTGLPNPAAIVSHKGVGEGRRYFMELMRKVLGNSGVSANRRNLELLSRSIINHVEVTDFSKAIPNAIPGDIVEYDTLLRNYEPREGSVTVPTSSVNSGYLERPTLHYSIGTRITPSVKKTLQAHKVPQITVHKDKPPFEPYMQRTMTNTLVTPDWLERLGGFYIGRGFLDTVHRGGSADLQGTSFIPSLVTGQPLQSTGLAD